MTGLEALVLLLLTPLVPFALALAPPRWRRTGAWQTAAALAALPALATSALMPAGMAATLPWLLEGSEFGLDVPGRAFLFFSAAVWLAAGVQARLSVPPPERSRFFLFFLLVMSGNLGLIVARDMLAFYLFFVLMSFAAYGLIVHGAGRESKRAGRVYITFVVAGDMLLFAALVLTALETGGSLLFTAAREAVLVSPYGNLIVALLVLGFGVKLGLLGLHVTLPLIYRAAPIPAAAVLAGSVINAGLLAWLRFLPFGNAMPAWGGTLIVLGLAAALYGVLAGLTQRDAATVLGYSSISQMGVITAGTGAALAAGAQSAAIIAAVAVYAMHHALAKGALFLGTGMTVFRPAGRASRIALRAGLLLPAAALAGTPLTSGMFAKEFLKHSLEDVPHAATAAFAVLLPWTGLVTTLIVARYLWLVWPLGASVPQAGAGAPRADGNPAAGHPSAAAIASPWVALLLLSAIAVWLLPVEDPPPVFAAGVVLETAWPVIAGTVLSLAVARAVAARRPRFPRVPPGDILVLAESALRRAGRTWAVFTRDGLPAARESLYEAGRAARNHSLWGGIAVRAENALGRWGLAMTLFIALAVLLAVATIRG